jgi:tetrapyrrole methylase family protein/MazG family protein
MTEAVAAIDLYHKTGNPENLCEELGDVLLQIVMLAQIAAESEVFGMDDVIHGVAEKMIRRHPHVFGDNKGGVEKEEVPGRWEEIKRKEKKDRTEEQKQQEKEAFADAAEQVIHHLSSR